MDQGAATDQEKLTPLSDYVYGPVSVRKLIASKARAKVDEGNTTRTLNFAESERAIRNADSYAWFATVGGLYMTGDNATFQMLMDRRRCSGVQNVTWMLETLSTIIFAGRDLLASFARGRMIIVSCTVATKWLLLGICFTGAGQALGR